MMSSDFRFRPEIKGTIKDAFDVSTPIPHRAFPNSPELAFKIYDVERRAASVREKSDEHFGKHRERWIELELSKLAKERPYQPGISQANGPRPPGGVSNRRLAHRDALLKLATANVELRHERRLHTINAIERLQKSKLTQEHRLEQRQHQKRRLSQ